MPKKADAYSAYATASKFCAKPACCPVHCCTTSRKFICKNVTLKPVSRKAPVSSALDPSTPITIPIAHGEGNYFIDDDGLKSLQDNDQVLFQYCDESGAVNAWSNPNGAVANIAGVANREMNVFGMMPHPERAASDDLVTPTARPSWRA